MYLKKLSLLNFKNYRELNLTFSERANCFVGNNGEGKTNLLDAIYYLSFCKSFFNSMDSQNILHDEPYFMVKGTYLREEIEEEVNCGLKRNQKKQFRLNGKEYQRLADHIGLIPLVMVSPQDSDIITGGSEIRRGFIDSAVSQFDKVYLNHLISYNKVIVQRNTLLKQFAENNSFNAESLDVWDSQLIRLAPAIYNTRIDFINRLIPIFQTYYKFLTGNKEKVKIVYESHLENADYTTVLKDSLKRDLILQYTTTGIHKDDLVFVIDEYPIKKFGSQGQQKSFVIALKLALFDFIKGVKKYKPILLLDDVFDKLDNRRVEQLIELVNGDSFGQIFITDTHPERMYQIFSTIFDDYKIFTVEGGTVKNVE